MSDDESSSSNTSDKIKANSNKKQPSQRERVIIDDNNDDNKSNKTNGTIPLASWSDDTSSTPTGTTAKTNGSDHAINMQDEEDEKEEEQQQEQEEAKNNRAAETEESSLHLTAPADSFAATTEELTGQCWKCSVPLKLDDNQFCFYAMHIHPLLKVPLCSVCCEEIAALRKSEAGGDNCDFCAGCSLPSEELNCLLLCDSCPLAFCDMCVAMTHGGGRVGWEVAQQLASDDGEWQCPCCKPPRPLQKLQNIVQEPDDSQGESNAEKKPRSIDQIVQELDAVEVEMAKCEDELEGEEQKLEEIREELGRTVNDDELSNAAFEELEKWKDPWEKHHRRLIDLASSLQDELETIHQVDLAKCYDKCLGFKKQDGKDEAEPEWKRMADYELAEKEKQRIGMAHDPSDPSVYKIDIPENVEDLNTQFPDEDTIVPSEWRQSVSRANKEQIQEALKYDNEFLAQNNVAVETVIDDEKDIQETLEEEQKASVLGEAGVSRIRTDVYGRMQEYVRSGEVRRQSSNSFARNYVAPTPGKGKITPRPGATIVIDSDDSESFDEVSTKDTMWDSPLLLCGGSADEKHVDTDLKNNRTVKVANSLAATLKEHQVDGVKFIWRNSFLDLAFLNTPEDISKDIGGCILAHNMGLGKSLTVITLLHTILNHPSLRCKSSSNSRRKKTKGLVHTALLVVPVNTLANWEREFERWTGDLEPSINIFSLKSTSKDARDYVIANWSSRGGVLLVSDKLFVRIAKPCPHHQETSEKVKQTMSRKAVPEEVCVACAGFHSLQSPGPDAVFLDEAHLMISNTNTETYKALSRINTRRKIVLTGSPLQNNLLEYFRMVSWVRPGVLGCSESVFDREYAEPIMRGLASDSTPEAVQRSQIQSRKLKEVLSPFISRKDASVLRDTLPPMQQVVLHIRPTKTQTRLYGAFNRYKKQHQINFFKEFHRLNPVHNHPGCLLLAEQTNQMKDSNEGNGRKDAVEDRDWTNEWWYNGIGKQKDVEKLKAIENGTKVVLLLHILTYAERLGDKVVLFTQCLKTLDFIEEVLKGRDWSSHVSSLKQSFPDSQLGGWQKGKDFLRIDGDIQASERGDLIEKFNDKVEESARLFLISSRAGGIGINLQAANRVILFDSHFNPTITLQALYRCYRFGQKKPVFAYRFLTEGTMEEKVYSRSVNKTGVSLRVVDGKSIGRSFTEKELQDLLSINTWVQCDNCDKWRMLFNFDGEENLAENLPDKWYCNMNESDPENNTCDATQKSERWYEDYQKRMISSSAEVTGVDAVTEKAEYGSNESSIPDEKKNSMTESDEILKHLLAVSEKKKDYISKHYFHEALLEIVKEDSAAVEGKQSGPQRMDPEETFSFREDSCSNEAARLPMDLNRNGKAREIYEVRKPKDPTAKRASFPLSHKEKQGTQGSQKAAAILAKNHRAANHSHRRENSVEKTPENGKQQKLEVTKNQGKIAATRGQPSANKEHPIGSKTTNMSPNRSSYRNTLKTSQKLTAKIKVSKGSIVGSSIMKKKAALSKNTSMNKVRTKKSQIQETVDLVSDSEDDDVGTKDTNLKVCSKENKPKNVGPEKNDKREEPKLDTKKDCQGKESTNDVEKKFTRGSARLRSKQDVDIKPEKKNDIDMKGGLKSRLERCNKKISGKSRRQRTLLINDSATKQCSDLVSPSSSSSKKTNEGSLRQNTTNTDDMDTKDRDLNNSTGSFKAMISKVETSDKDVSCSSPEKPLQSPMTTDSKFLRKESLTNEKRSADSPKSQASLPGNASTPKGLKDDDVDKGERPRRESLAARRRKVSMKKLSRSRSSGNDMVPASHNSNSEGKAAFGSTVKTPNPHVKSQHGEQSPVAAGIEAESESEADNHELTEVRKRPSGMESQNGDIKSMNGNSAEGSQTRSPQGSQPNERNSLDDSPKKRRRDFNECPQNTPSKKGKSPRVATLLPGDANEITSINGCEKEQSLQQCSPGERKGTISPKKVRQSLPSREAQLLGEKSPHSAFSPKGSTSNISNSRRSPRLNKVSRTSTDDKNFINRAEKEQLFDAVEEGKLSVESGLKRSLEFHISPKSSGSDEKLPSEVSSPSKRGKLTESSQPSPTFDVRRSRTVTSPERRRGREGIYSPERRVGDVAPRRSRSRSRESPSKEGKPFEKSSPDSTESSASNKGNKRLERLMKQSREITSPARRRAREIASPLRNRSVDIQSPERKGGEKVLSPQSSRGQLRQNQSRSPGSSPRDPSNSSSNKEKHLESSERNSPEFSPSNNSRKQIDNLLKRSREIKSPERRRGKEFASPQRNRSQEKISPRGSRDREIKSSLESPQHSRDRESSAPQSSRKAEEHADSVDSSLRRSPKKVSNALTQTGNLRAAAGGALSEVASRVRDKIDLLCYSDSFSSEGSDQDTIFGGIRKATGIESKKKRKRGIQPPEAIELKLGTRSTDPIEIDDDNHDEVSVIDISSDDES